MWDNKFCIVLNMKIIILRIALVLGIVFFTVLAVMKKDEAEFYNEDLSNVKQSINAFSDSLSTQIRIKDDSIFNMNVLIKLKKSN
jgi:predicted amino acid-binding ACT domain protein